MPNNEDSFFTSTVYTYIVVVEKIRKDFMKGRKRTEGTLCAEVRLIRKIGYRGFQQPVAFYK